MEIIRHSFSVIVPAFNEEKAIKDILNKLKDSLMSNQIEHEITVVDDASIDNTANIVETVKDVILLRHPHNMGYGAAIKTGVTRAKYNYIAIIDADGTYPAVELINLIRQLDDKDMIVGARTGDIVRVPLVRKPAKWILGKLANYLTGTRIKDLNSGMRIMKKEVIEKFLNILPDGFSFTTTITLAMLTNDYTVKYVPINYYERKGKSKIRPFKDTLNFIQLIVRTVMFFEPLKIFIPMSIVMFLASLLVLILSYLLTGRVMDVTVVILFVSGVQLFAIGLIADLIDKRMRD